MTKLSLLALSALASLLTGTAHADDVSPQSAKSVSVAEAVGVVYYTEETEGFRVVATLSASEGAAPLRFTATLADGQTVTVSVPVEAGQAERAIDITRNGETLSVTEATPLMVRASLD